MRSLVAAISAGDFGFTDWAFAAEAPSEIAVQVAIATRKNNALIIISFHIRSFSRMRPMTTTPGIRHRERPVLRSVCSEFVQGQADLLGGFRS